MALGSTGEKIWSTWRHQHPLLASCVVHYELEFIHPFADGNGRLGRLWQTLTLSRWNPLLAWLPIEEVIRARQQGYYDSLGQADQQGELEPFVSYLLTAIEDALQEAIRTQGTAATAGSEMSSEIGSEILSPREVEVLELLTAPSPGFPPGNWLCSSASASGRSRSIWLPCNDKDACGVRARHARVPGRCCPRAQGPEP